MSRSEQYMNHMTAVLTCVNYGDILAVTLPINRHHFDRVIVATEPSDGATISACKKNTAEVFLYDFKAGGREFAKWAALEAALSFQGRQGWLCLMDADIVWPAEAPMDMNFGTLTTPLRRMAPWTGKVPEDWSQFPVHQNIGEHAGYTQVFHADDTALGLPPWHDTSWKHAGGADSFFQRKWPLALKVRPPWDCLHMGEAGRNWCGKGGETKLRAYFAERRRRGDFSAEKL